MGILPEMNTCTHAQTHTHTHVYIYVYIYIYIVLFLCKYIVRKLLTLFQKHNRYSIEVWHFELGNNDFWDRLTVLHKIHTRTHTYTLIYIYFSLTIKCSNNDFYHGHLNVRYFFHSLGRFRYLFSFLCSSLSFYVLLEKQNSLDDKFFSSYKLKLDLI